MTRSLRALPLAVCALGASSAAQSVTIHDLNGTHPWDRFGRSVCGVGDWNGDAWPDFAASLDTGSVEIHSGADGALLQSLPTGGRFQGAVQSIAIAGDVDADGLEDVIAGVAHPMLPGGAVVFSGADGTVLLSIPSPRTAEAFGRSVAGVGDMNGDGHADVLIGAPGHGVDFLEPGSAWICSGLDGAVLWSVVGDGPLANLGYAVSSTGDFDGDGVDDFAIGAPGSSQGGYERGLFTVHSGATGAVVLSLAGSEDLAGYGAALANAGDVDGDGNPDLIVGSNGGLPALSGFARVFSSADGALLHEFHGTQPRDYFGRAVAGGGDADGDGHADLIVGAYGGSGTEPRSGAVYVYSGFDGGLLHRLGGDGSADRFGYSVDFVGDVNADGYDDLLIGALQDSDVAHLGGSVLVSTGQDVSDYSYCFGDEQRIACPCGNPDEHAGCANSTGVGARLASAGSLSLLEAELTFRASDLPVGRTALLFAGSVMPGPKGSGEPFGDGLRCAGGHVQRLGTRSAGPEGDASWGPELLRVGGWSAGDQRFFQAWYRDPAAADPCGAGFNLSNGVAITFMR